MKGIVLILNLLFICFLGEMKLIGRINLSFKEDHILQFTESNANDFQDSQHIQQQQKEVEPQAIIQIIEQIATLIIQIFESIDCCLANLVQIIPQVSGAQLKLHDSRILYNSKAKTKFTFKDEFPALIDLSNYFSSSTGFENLNFRIFFVEKGDEKKLPSDNKIISQDLSNNIPCFVSLDGFVLNFDIDQSYDEKQFGGKCYNTGEEPKEKYTIKVVAIDSNNTSSVFLEYEVVMGLNQFYLEVILGNLFNIMILLLIL